jgi:transcription-repair coupling factor (superfamily II helicase)
MRDLEIRGAGNLLGDEQSGHVAAVGFELYCQMLEDAAESLRTGAELPEEPRQPVRIEVDVDAYIPADYIPFEAAKIDVHRRVAAAREPGELRALRGELEDRFGALPESVSSLLDLQRVRIALGDAGARTVEFRAGRLRVSPVELDSERAAVLNEHVPEAIYQWRERTVGVPVPDDPGARLGALIAVADGLSAALAARAPAEAA